MKKKTEIDIRNFRLGKWYIPKQTQSFGEEQEGYHALGYFDIITVEAPKEAEVEKIHVWSDSYKTSYRMSKQLQSEYFMQEIKAFTNVSDNPEYGFSKGEIARFWKDESLLLCMSMLHVPLDAQVSTLINDINRLFENKDYLYYYSFDYCGVIVVAKNMNIHEYLKLMFKLTYDYHGHTKIVKDTYSVYGLQKKKVLEYLGECEGKSEAERHEIEENYFKDTHKYEMAINISVRNYAEYMMFKEELEKFEESNCYKSEKHELPGRHDISIVNKEAKFHWLLKIQQLLDSHSLKSKKAFYAYETFVKIADDDNVGEREKPEESEKDIYEQLSENLEDAYENVKDTLLNNQYYSYITPIREVCNSILSILKNAFAEDFVLCMYQAFWGFLRYLDEKINQENKQAGVMYDKEIELCFESFFDGLSALVNSAMHTDRQFIQSTSFSAIFYDVPPKIMAFYVAMIQKICGIMSKDDKYKYTFLMKPGFSDEISVKKISFQVNNAEDRIYQIAINERFLYHPHAVMRRIAHEIAHFKGDGLRKRDVRKEKLMRTYIHTIFDHCLPRELGFDKWFYALSDSVYDFFANISGFGCVEENYAYQVETKYKAILRYIIQHEDIQVLLRRYVKEELLEMKTNGSFSCLRNMIEEEKQKKGIFVVDVDDLQNTSEIQMQYLEELLLEKISENLHKLIEREEYAGIEPNQDCDGILDGQSMKQYVSSLVALYGETYADVQMIQVLGISYTEYLNSFLMDEKLDIQILPQNGEDLSRIAVVSKLMRDEKVWELQVEKKELESLHEIIVDFIERMDHKDDVYYMQNYYLQRYLGECLRESKEHYAKEAENIDDVREKMKIIVEHKDVQEVYCTICQVLCEYRDELKKLTWETKE